MIVEKIRRVTLTNGLVRMEAVTFGPNGEEQLAGVIQLPASQAGNVLENMHSALQRLQQGQSGSEGPSPRPRGRAARCCVWARATSTCAGTWTSTDRRW